MTIYGKYFYGNEVSAYGQEHGYVDYRTFAKAFDAVLNNDIIEKTSDIGYWEQVSGFIDHSDEIDALNAKIGELQEQITADSTDEEDKNIDDQIKKINDQIEELEEEQDYVPEVYQWYIVDDSAFSLLKEANEIVYHNDDLDIYVWGVTHY